MTDRTELTQALKDAACDDQICQRVICFLERNRTDDAIRILRGHRCGLLEELHEHQRRIDCLDYLVHKLNKE